MNKEDEADRQDRSRVEGILPLVYIYVPPLIYIFRKNISCSDCNFGAGQELG